MKGRGQMLIKYLPRLFKGKRPKMNQRKYYLRIFDSFFHGETAQRFEDSPHRYAMYVLYQKMLLRSMRFEGRIMYRGAYADLEEQLAKEFGETRDMIIMILSYFTALGIVQKQDRYIFFPEAARLSGSESESAERVRRYRRRKAKKRYKVTNSGSKSDNVTVGMAESLQSNEPQGKGRYNVTAAALQSNGQEAGRFEILIGDEGISTSEKPRDHADIEDE